jgi:hypothetical protein
METGAISTASPARQSGAQSALMFAERHANGGLLRIRPSLQAPTSDTADRTTIILEFEFYGGSALCGS